MTNNSLYPKNNQTDPVRVFLMILIAIAMITVVCLLVGAALNSSGGFESYKK